MIACFLSSPCKRLIRGPESSEENANKDKSKIQDEMKRYEIDVLRGAEP